MSKQQTYDYGCMMIYFNFPELKSIHSKIDKEDIYVEESDRSYGLENNPHCTLLYGIHSNEVEDNEVFDKIKDIKIDEIILESISIFENEKYDVLKFSIKNDQCTEANSKLKELPHTSDFPDYNAHSTIAYLKPGLGKKYVEMLKDLKYTAIGSKLVYSKPDGNKIEKLMKSFNEDQFILDLIKAQTPYKGDPSHGGKLVKKQIIDKNGKKQTEWVKPEDFNKPIDKDKKQDQSKDQNQQQDEKPNTDFIDNLANEDKAKLELIKEMIDSGDHINAKQLADGLSDEVKHFIPKDVWKDLYEQEQIETNGVKVEEKKESKKKESKNNKFNEDFFKPNNTATLQQAEEKLKSLGFKNFQFKSVSRANGVSFYFVNESGQEIRVSDHPLTGKRAHNTIDIPLFDRKKISPIKKETSGFKLTPEMIASAEARKLNKSQMNIFQQGKQLINKAIDNVKDFFNPNTTIQEFADVIVFNENFDILLLKRANGIKIEPNKWWLPGGHMELNEEPVVAAYRELQEETAITNDINEFNKIDTISNADRLVHYYTTFLNNDNVVIDLDEHSEYKWVSIFDLKDMQLAFNQLDILVDVSLKAKKVMSYCILKQAFNQGKISEDEFLKILQSKNTKE